MRRTAEAGRSPGAAPAAGPARRRQPAAPAVATDTADAPTADAPQRSGASTIAVAATRMIRVDEGLYTLSIGAIGGPPTDVGGMTVPVVHVSAPFAEDGNAVEIVASFPRRGPWLGREGGTVILRSPAAGGYVIAAVYAAPGQRTGELSLDLRRLDGAADAADAAEPPGVRVEASGGGQAVTLTGMRDVPTEIMLHIERAGDRVFPGRGWVGALGRRMRIEAISVRPLEHLAPTDIELKGFLPDGGETPWVSGGALCGTRGRGLPLTGFAVRVVPQRADRFEVQYQGSFFIGGISETRRDGDPCRATTANDALEAINVRLTERVPEPETDETAE
jgi:hypothetical protein